MNNVPGTEREYLTNNMVSPPPPPSSTRAQRRRQLAIFKASKKFDAAELAYLKRAMKGLQA
ncbi:hypothetical protein [Mesorhizobium sp. STM 4661]|uniref:hypothetical protein n=1 Tax=Mesorhizobium sp. STM 4661 TaxID=1297570 RepID=UPI0002BE3A49|nr:hypothetical protein [Mesorhizobium sp. STM 4661]CCV12892.1 hypothetical protein MESS4_510059 [Mesorhizobium sp. STM 4661]